MPNICTGGVIRFAENKRQTELSTPAGQLLTEDGPFASDTVTNTYVNRLRTRLDLQQPTSFWTNGFAYDAARRLTNVGFAGGNFAYSFMNDASLLPKKIALPNTSYITNVYDSVARMLGTYLKSNNAVTLEAAVYGYNTGNQRTTFTNGAGADVAYTYDDIGQLKIANSVTNTEDRGYTYDAAWNLNYRTNNGALVTFTVDSKNQLTDFNGDTVYYDDNGNLASAITAMGASIFWFTMMKTS